MTNKIDPTRPDYHGPCPRCGSRVPNYDGDHSGALSREAHVYICSDCGRDEAKCAIDPTWPIRPLGTFGRV